MKIYISGKIGEMVISDKTREKFEKAEKRLKAEGHEVINPACHDFQVMVTTWVDAIVDSGFDQDYYAETLLQDLDWLKKCDAIYLLSDYQDSPGALVELAFARAIGIDIIYEDVEAHVAALKEKLAVLNSIATEYGGRTLDNIIDGIGHRVEFYEKKEINGL